jgi:nickel superoxide dismutase
MRGKISTVLALVLFMLAIAPNVFSHCEIPCGIYGDEIRFYMIEEHVSTIEKSMITIVELSQQEDKNYNQLVRWIDNKETHADFIQEIVSQYFLTQRVKPVSEKDVEEHKKYIGKITLLHKMLISAMKMKQTTDLENIKEFKTLLAIFRAAYFGAERGEHRPPHMEHGE